MNLLDIDLDGLGPASRVALTTMSIPAVIVIVVGIVAGIVLLIPTIVLAFILHSTVGKSRMQRLAAMELHTERELAAEGEDDG
jgi:hypothetical protein